MAIFATCLLASVTSHAANPWDGKFRAVAEKNEQQTLYWNVEVQCDRHDECQATSVLDTVYVPAIHKANERSTPYSGALPFNESITSGIRESIVRGHEKDDGKDSRMHYDRRIYRQIALPEHVLECRGGFAENPATICRLSGKLIGGVGRKSALILLVPDMDPNGVCPNSFCPVALYKQGSP